MAFNFHPDLAPTYALNPFLVPYSSDVSYPPLPHCSLHLCTFAHCLKYFLFPTCWKPPHLLVSSSKATHFQVFLWLFSVVIKHSLFYTSIPLCAHFQYHIFIVERAWVGCLKYLTTVWHVDQVNQNSEDETFLCLVCGESQPRKDWVVVVLDP